MAPSSGREIRREVDADLDARLGPFVVVLRPFVAPWAVYHRLEAQAAGLRGLPTRTAPTAPAAHYQAIPHTELYAMVNTGVDPGAVAAAADLWHDIGTDLAAFGDEVARAIADDATEWTGTAGDQARRAVADLGEVTGAAGAAALLAGTLWMEQSVALSTARAAVPPPPPPFDATAAAATLNTITDPIAFVRQGIGDLATYTAQHLGHQAAALAVELYDQAVVRTSSAQPAFTTFTDSGDRPAHSGPPGIDLPAGPPDRNSPPAPVPADGNTSHGSHHGGPGTTTASSAPRPGSSTPRTVPAGADTSSSGNITTGSAGPDVSEGHRTAGSPLTAGSSLTAGRRTSTMEQRTRNTNVATPQPPRPDARTAQTGHPPPASVTSDEDTHHKTPEYLRTSRDDVFGPDPGIPPAVLGDWGGEQWRHLPVPEE